MPSLIYENRSFLNNSKIESDGENLVFTRKNISGETLKEVKLSHIKKIRAEKDMVSYSLVIEKENGEQVTFGGLDKKAVEVLKRNLGSMVEIKAAKSLDNITLEEAKQGAKKILGNLSGDFDARHLLSYFINMGVQLDCSDIHITPRKEMTSVQFRMDGLLQEIAQFSNEIHARFLATLKNRAKLPSYKKSTPQDGSFHFDEGSLNIDVRCATIPTMFGEKVVLRILNTSKTPLFLEDLGLFSLNLSAYEKLITQPQGCVILTGPAGSGKTTTIFASLIHLYNVYEGTVNIATIEDPAEYIVPQFQQTQVNPAIGLTFDAGLKALLRLDPDIMMVGEIRDPETAVTAVRTSLTGHLIFTTLHARDSIGVFPRMVEMGIKPGMVSSSVTAVLYQRLLRKLCPHCKYETEPPHELLKTLTRHKEKIHHYYTARGCEKCSGTRYMGRTGVFELLTVDEEIRDMITRGAQHGEIYDYCEKQGMKFMWDNALLKIKTGVTDYDEVLRVCPPSGRQGR